MNISYKFENKQGVEQMTNVRKTLIVVSGISASGKTTLSHKLKIRLNCKMLSMDDCKVDVYEQYGFKNEYERKILWDMAKCKFQAEIIQVLRKGGNIIVEYNFDVSWQDYFDTIARDYGYTLVIIHCDTRDFDDIWESRVNRDSNNLLRPLCLTARAYIKGVLYETNGKLNDTYKEEKRKQYETKKYTSLRGNFVFTDKEIQAMLKDAR